MITPSFSLTATERVLPKLALDFTTASLDSRVTFTRAGNTATVVNSNGFVVPINADLPRFDYDPITLACKGLLIEESRTNLFTYSEQINNTTLTGATVSVDATVSPSNVLNADKIVEDTSTGTHGFSSPSIAWVANTQYTMTIYVKKDTRFIFDIIFAGGANWTGGRQVVFNLNTVTAASDGARFSIQALGNNWYRCQATATSSAAPSASTANVRLNNDAGAASYTGDGTSGMFFWGAQIETGSFPTSYIPTVASQVTRTADVATMTGTNFSDWYNQSEGSFLVTTIVPPDIANSVIQVSNSSTGYSNLIGIARQASGLNRFQSDFQSGGTRQALLSQASNSFPVNTLSKYCFTYKQDRFAGSTNASAIVSDTSGLVPVSLNRLGLGRDVVGSASYLNGYLQKVFYWPQSLINAELQAFSK